MEAIEQAQLLDRHSVRDRAARQFDSDRIVDSLITAVNRARPVHLLADSHLDSPPAK